MIKRFDITFWKPENKLTKKIYRLIIKQQTNIYMNICIDKHENKDDNIHKKRSTIEIMDGNTEKEVC